MHDDPQYFDLQVNGYGGVDFNADGLTAEAFDSACQLMQRDGVSGCLATVITDHIDVMCRRLRAIAQFREESAIAQKIIAGIHIEGPFLNGSPGFPGAHPTDALCPADTDITRALLDAGHGLVRLFTLAPEHDANMQVTRFLASRGIVVSAGHCDSTVDQLRAAIDAGLSMFTHLGNGCPATLHRHDNIVQRVLFVAQETKLWCCFIADGVHVPAFALTNYLRLVGVQRAIIVTDGTAPSGFGPGTYTLGRWTVTIGEDLVARSPDGTQFLGSASTMRDCDRILRQKLGLGDADAKRLTYLNPRAALGL